MLVMVAIVVVPFLLFGDQLDGMVRAAMEGPSSRIIVACVGVLLLAADVVLPIPSTFVIAGLGAAMGIGLGTALAALGLTLGCGFGYWLGRSLGQGFAERTINFEDLGYIRSQLERHGTWILGACRPVPVLAEASVVVAGVAGLPAGKVLLVTTLANIGVAAVYAFLGASAETRIGFAGAVIGAVALPVAAMFVARAWKNRVSAF